MVFQFYTRYPYRYILLIGEHKEDNDQLVLNYGIERDIWFHVDKFPSAHVYLRLKNEDENIHTIPKQVLLDCVQIVKENSRIGKKNSNLIIIYTPWSNLLKRKGMHSGEVGFKDIKKCERITIKRRDSFIIRQIYKTKRMISYDELSKMRDDFLLYKKKNRMKLNKKKSYIQFLENQKKIEKRNELERKIDQVLKNEYLKMNISSNRILSLNKNIKIKSNQQEFEDYDDFNNLNGDYDDFL